MLPNHVDHPIREDPEKYPASAQGFLTPLSSKIVSYQCSQPLNTYNSQMSEASTVVYSVLLVYEVARID